ncbi:hypothetical protein MUU72_01210 [Streptomyces sp. RS10V-4]|uniref:hypothetical protein n=1 Tax=Streptomyces rhizoryzae TaxID=2932493 RepID=UPI002002B0D6|nr:hypothetical protein [Streptomyces rhizoryzae]MCK7621759.1 hypothetical protein [Streptomyces rhizoryzae]
MIGTKRVVRAVVGPLAVAVAAVGLAGCSSGAGDAGRPDGAGKQSGTQGSGTQVSAEAFARTYQKAVNGQDWQHACRMRTDRYRHGSVQACVADNTESTPSATPSPSESSEPPLRRADGSIVPPRPKPSTSGPDRAETGPVTAAGEVPVPAIGEHPAGIGIGVQYTVTWPSGTTTTKKALRLVRQGGRWLVDQAEDVYPSDEAHGNPVRDALMRP